MSSNGDSTATFNAIADIIVDPNKSFSISAKTSLVSTFYSLWGRAETAKASNTMVINVFYILIFAG
jgi:hypothetical protein